MTLAGRLSELLDHAARLVEDADAAPRGLGQLVRGKLAEARLLIAEALVVVAEAERSEADWRLRCGVCKQPAATLPPDPLGGLALADLLRRWERMYDRIVTDVAVACKLALDADTE